MPTRPRLIRSIPFWGLLVVSLATIAVGWYITSDKLGTMTTTLTDGSATGVDVYVGQSIAQLGSILIGAGVVGVLLTLAIAALSTLRPQPPVEVVEPIDWDSEAETAADPADVAPFAEPTEPVVDTAPAVSDVTPASADATPAPAKDADAEASASR